MFLKSANSQVERLSDNEIYNEQPSSLDVVSILNLTKGAEIDSYSNTLKIFLVLVLVLVLRSS